MIVIIPITKKRGDVIGAYNNLLLLFLAAAVITDMRETKISNRLIASGLFLGLALRIAEEGSVGIVHFLVDISIPVILLFLLFQMRALGAGDIKLFSVAGGFLGTKQLLDVMAAAFIVASVIGIGKMLYVWYTAGRQKEKRTMIHFSPAILIGYLIVVGRGMIA